MSKIFISYRREDSQWQTKAIYERLSVIVDNPREDIFFDLDSMTVGLNFKTQIQKSVEQCDVLIAMIGPKWVNEIDKETGTRRLDDSKDFVRLEVAAALERDIPVIPVFLDGAPVPATEELPDNIKELSDRHGIKIHAESFENDVGLLLKSLNRLGVGLQQQHASKLLHDPLPAPKIAPVASSSITDQEDHFDVYLSYTSNNEQIARALVGEMTSQGRSVWWDKSIEKGVDWRLESVRAIELSKAFVVLFSKESNSSKRLKKELAIADNLDKIVIPVMIDDATPKGHLLYELASRNWIQLFPHPESKIVALVERIVQYLSLDK